MKKGSVLSRSAAVLLLVLILASVVRFVIVPVMAAHQRYDTMIADLLVQRSRFAAHAGDIRQQEEELVTLKQTRSSQEMYLAETSESLAGAALIGRVNKIIDQQGGTLISSQILGKQEKEDIPSVTVRAHMRVSMDALPAILYHLETGYPATFLDDVRITARTVRRPFRSRGKPLERKEEVILEAVYTVTGYMRPKER